MDGRLIIAVNRNIRLPKNAAAVLVVPEGSIIDNVEDFVKGRLHARWHMPKPLKVSTTDTALWEKRCEEVRNSWKDKFYFKEEKEPEPGLRPPQIGALHAVLAHWKVTHSPATIVMPTGTGKTETMLALLIREQITRLLVVVPTNALREQIGNKFKTLGLLKRFGIISPDCKHPLVCTLSKRPTNKTEVDNIFKRSNVIVTTMAILSGCNDEVVKEMADICSHLFIDEAHHIPAPSWDKFRKYFKSKPIVQFTATPFRTDGKYIDGKIIFNYPLKKAQAEGYFKPIQFIAVNEWKREQADMEIARIAVEQLKKDLSSNLDHILMARTSDIKRASEIHKLYLNDYPDYNPILIHSNLPKKSQSKALEMLLNRKTRIVVCVQMLGEGFDLPELKIAALHDIHKSLAITLQFTGRFTRKKDTIGNATVVANIAVPGVEEALQDLYADDADWNSLLQVLSEGATGRQILRSDFLKEFRDVPEEIPLQNIFPKMSTVVFRTSCSRWNPEKAVESIKERNIFVNPTVNHTHNVVLFITRETEPVPWGNIREIQNIQWHLYVVHWNKDLGLLFINSSNNASHHENIAKSIAGQDVQLIHGEEIFRSLHDVNYLILMNLGLNHSISRAMRFTMYMGSDVASGLRGPESQNKIKSNLFGKGYEKGDRTTIGCSQKGRIWSYRVAYDMAAWVKWCEQIGKKLIDSSINTESIFKNVIIPERIIKRPNLYPLTIEWPEEFLERQELLTNISICDRSVAFFDADLELLNPSRDGKLCFRVAVADRTADYEIRFINGGVEYVAINEQTANVLLGKKIISLSDAFRENWPIVRFENGGFLNYDELCTPRQPEKRTPFDKGEIIQWKWDGIDIRKESQTEKKLNDSIQFKVIQELISSGRYDVVFNDDGPNEIADVIALKEVDSKLIVDLFHCKFSSSSTPGARVDDLYAVCGQAIRSVYWKGSLARMFERMRFREMSYRDQKGISRFELGDFSDMINIGKKVHTLTAEFNIYIVQPGLSCAAAENNQLELLSATDVYLNDTYAVKLFVIASS
ncbi:MAG TPA: DEAD/DEAH box helicase family protein [Chitinophagaceae bacterium]|nr:DEAD/DEAH box helicase family protein [Chitinophagaceae bacterium]